MATTGGSGFDAGRLRKLVALFDSPSHQEAANAFKLALDELAKNNLRFSDQWADAEDAKRAVKESSGLRADRDKYRAERDEYLARCTKQQTEATELEQTISRLHDHIREMEAAVSPEPSPHSEDDWLPGLDDRPSPHVPPAPVVPPRSGSSHLSKIYNNLAAGVALGFSQFMDRVAVRAHGFGRKLGSASGKLAIVAVVVLIILIIVIVNLSQ